VPKRRVLDAGTVEVLQEYERRALAEAGSQIAVACSPTSAETAV
jgi:hypothetical protein